MHLNKKGTATVELSDDHIIVCRLVGEITGDVAAASMRETRVLAERVRTEGYTPLLLIDISQITKQTSEARTRAKELNTMKIERVAICGGHQGIVLAGKYIARAAGMEGYTHFFKTEETARDWLVSGVEKSATDSTLAKRSIVSLLMIILSVGALVGWQLDVPVLRSIVPDLAPMNPMTAATALLLALAIISMSKGWHAGHIRRMIVNVVAMWSVFFGVAVLARYLFSVDTGLDAILFADKLEWGRFSGRASSSAGILFLCAGTMLSVLLGTQRQAWTRHIFFALSGLIFLMTMSVLIGYSFGFDSLTFGGSTPISIATTLVFICFNFVIVGLSKPTKSYLVSIRIFYAYWQAIVVCLLLILATGISWQQVKHNINDNVAAESRQAFLKAENTLASRLHAYSDALNGYKGLFAASDDVSPAEFNNYFLNSNIQTSYPGFLAITYVAAVPDGQKQVFIKDTRARASDAFPQYGSFMPFPENNNALHFPVLYTEPHTPATRYGFDLSSEAGRRTALEEARDKGEIVGSEVIDLNASQKGNAPERPGFFIAAPVYQRRVGVTTPKDIRVRREQIQGFILAYFQNDRLFTDIFPSKDNNAQYSVTDVSSGRVVFVSEARNVRQDADVAYTGSISTGGKTWRLTLRVSPEFGMTEVYERLPRTVLSSGILISILAFFLISGQLRRRDQALQTAAEITEDLNAERNTAVAVQRKDEAVLTSIGDAVFAIDVKGRITLFNLACERISGYQASEVIGKHYADVLHFSFEKSGRMNDGFIRQALAGHISSMKNHTVLRRKDGKIVSVADSAAPIYDVEGKLLGVIVVFRDVSKEYELDRAKTEFVSLASHQLRTPLSAINWYGELLLGGDAGKLNQDQKEYIEQIHHGSLRMIELVNSLLDVSRLDLGKLSNQPVATDMKELAEGLERELASMTESKDLRVTIDAAKNLHSVSADPKLLRMIVQNLFSNAVKYTPPKGDVTLILRQAIQQETTKARLRGDAYFYLAVKDTGYGIPESQHAKIFGKLFRADNVRGLDVEGTGLGLYIVKQVTEKLGGKVWFESAENKGTTFHVLLPFKTKVLKSNSKQPGEA